MRQTLLSTNGILPVSSGVLPITNIAQIDTDIEGAHIRHAQLSPGVLRGELCRIQFASSVLDCGCFNQRLCGTGSLRGDAYVLLFLTEPTDVGHLNNQRLVHGVWIYQPGEEISGVIPPDWQWYSLAVSTEALEPTMETLGIDPSTLPRLGTGPIAQHARLDYLEHLIRNVHREASRSGPLHGAELLEERLLLAFLTTMGTTPSRLTRDWRPHPLMRRARDYLAANTQRTISTAELCRQLNCSRRQIELAFNDVYDLGPIAYHRKLRLNESRRQLLRQSPQRGQVSIAANEHGFSHLGRFASEYKALFGERPSQTSQG